MGGGGHMEPVGRTHPGLKARGPGQPQLWGVVSWKGTIQLDLRASFLTFHLKADPIVRVLLTEHTQAGRLHHAPLGPSLCKSTSVQLPPPHSTDSSALPLGNRAELSLAQGEDKACLSSS